MFQLVVWAVVLGLKVCLAAYDGVNMKSLYSGAYASLWMSSNSKVPQCWFSTLSFWQSAQVFGMTACIYHWIMWTWNLVVLSSYMGVCYVRDLWWDKERPRWCWPAVISLVDDQIHGVGGFWFWFFFCALGQGWINFDVKSLAIVAFMAFWRQSLKHVIMEALSGSILILLTSACLGHLWLTCFWLCSTMLRSDGCKGCLLSSPMAMLWRRAGLQLLAWPLQIDTLWLGGVGQASKNRVLQAYRKRPDMEKNTSQAFCRF